jgi:hypothetical protein
VNTAILISIIFSALVSVFAALIFYKHVRDLLEWRRQALMTLKRTRIRQELIQCVSDHRQQTVRA